MKEVIPYENIKAKILLIRGQKVMLDRDLASLYGVTTGNLNKAVKRNFARFPADFMFRLSKEEFENLIFRFGISSWGGTRKMPYAFTEPGVAMLSTVLKSERAIQINIAIIRTFIKLRDFALSYKILAEKLNALECGYKKHDKKITEIFVALRLLASEDAKEGKEIGFKTV